MLLACRRLLHYTAISKSSVHHECMIQNTNILFSPSSWKCEGYSKIPVLSQERSLWRAFTSSAAPAPSLGIERANARTIGSVQLKTANEKGWGVFADRDFAKGETVISALSLKCDSHQDSHSIQRGWEQHVTMDLPARFLNHMCQPNLGVEPNEAGAYDFVALAPISSDDEVGFDYETTEYEMSLDCQCGAPSCKGRLRGFRHNREQVIASQVPVAPYLLY